MFITLTVYTVLTSWFDPRRFLVYDIDIAGIVHQVELGLHGIRILLHGNNGVGRRYQVTVLLSAMRPSRSDKVKMGYKWTAESLPNHSSQFLLLFLDFRSATS